MSLLPISKNVPRNQQSSESLSRVLMNYTAGLQAEVNDRTIPARPPNDNQWDLSKALFYAQELYQNRKS
jgi:hypothetical protein